MASASVGIRCDCTSPEIPFAVGTGVLTLLSPCDVGAIFSRGGVLEGADGGTKHRVSLAGC